MSPGAARQIGKYTLLYELAAGGMAVVFVARQVAAGGVERVVVVKRIHRHFLEDAEIRTMWLDEARVASQLKHPHAVSVIDVIDDDDELCLVMDYVESVPLSKLLASATPRRLAPAIACRIVVDMLAGLDAAHDAVDGLGRKLDVVHRDVSPQNLIVGADGHSRVIDFGIARAAYRATVTRSEVIKGKAADMASGADTGRRGRAPRRHLRRRRGPATRRRFERGAGRASSGGGPAG